LKHNNKKLLATLLSLIAIFSLLSETAYAKEKPVAFKKGSCADRLFQVKKSPVYYYASAQSVLVQNKIFRTLLLARNPAKRKPSTSLCVTVITKSPFLRRGEKLDLPKSYS
jgi:hypothetical protein